MSENMNIEAMETVDLPEAGSEKYTIDYVLEQIENLQKQITENSFHSLHRLEEAVSSIYETDAESDEGEENRNSSVACVCEIFRYREITLQKLLAFYEKMYDDLKPKATKPAMQVDEAITSMVHNFIIQKADYVATHPYEINAEEIRHLFEEIEQVVRLTPPI